MSFPDLMGHKVLCVVPSCGKRVSRNRSGNYSGHRWGTSKLTCSGGGTPALETKDSVSLNLAGHAVTGIITWLGWDTTGMHPGAVATIDVAGQEVTRRTALLRRLS